MYLTIFYERTNDSLIYVGYDEQTTNTIGEMTIELSSVLKYGWIFVTHDYGWYI